MSLIADELKTKYQSAERRLRDALLGDGVYRVGVARGEEARELVARELRRMRESFDSALRATEELAQANARAASLEEELKGIASQRARARKSKPRKAA